MGSPPPLGSKNDVFMLRSVSSMVIAPANTGKDRRRRTAVISTDHAKSEIFSIFMDSGRMFRIVAIKLMAPRIDLTPAKCREKIAISTDGPL